MYATRERSIRTFLVIGDGDNSIMYRSVPTRTNTNKQKRSSKRLFIVCSGNVFDVERIDCVHSNCLTKSSYESLHAKNLIYISVATFYIKHLLRFVSKIVGVILCVRATVNTTD